jgi:hypothetical protein
MGNQPTDLRIGAGARALAGPRARARARAGAGAGARALLGEFSVLLGVLFIGAAVLIVDGNEISWLAGVIAGGGAGAWVALRRGSGRTRRLSPTEERAEQSTASAVAPLESAGWRFLHDVRGLDTTFDHIAIGHGGVIVLQSVRADGVVSMRGGEPVVEWLSGSHGSHGSRGPNGSGAAARCQRLRPRAVSDAAALRADVERVTGRRLWAQALVVIWSEFPAGCITDGRCVYIHGSRLADWLARRPHQLDPAEADGIAAAVDTLVKCNGERPVAA